MNVLVCFGTRPEAIKMVPVIFELRRLEIPFKICVTAQHREMLDQVLKFFNVLPDYDLDLMEENQSLNKLSGKLFQKIDNIFDLENPSLVLVHGDTTSSVIVALAAFYKNIKVAHIEAGLRTYNKEAPFPEEVNRQLTSRITDFHFAPTTSAAENLKREGISERQIHITGNTIVDAVEWAKKRLDQFKIKEEVSLSFFDFDASKRFILVTGHRRESFGDGLKNLCRALIELSEMDGVNILFPVHPNPRVQEPVLQFLSHKKNIHLIPPLSYPALLWIMKRSALVISDSGGIQEEAPAFGKRVLVTRDISERMEGIDEGFSVLVGLNKEKIVKEALNELHNPTKFIGKKNPYGEGNAAEKIVDILIKSLDV